MPRFFVSMDTPARVGDPLTIEARDAAHIRLSLRMTVGDTVTVCDGRGNDYETVIAAADEQRVTLTVTAVSETQSEPSVVVTIYQGYPKGDKLELIVQKAVELGAARIVPVVTARSIAKPLEKADKKQARLQKIADEAAGQSGRGILPVVERAMTLREVLPRLEKEKLLVLYEGGGQPLREAVSSADSAVSLFIGPEGGIAPEELSLLLKAGGQAVSLGKRILRCETAPLAALAAVMTLTGDLE